MIGRCFNLSGYYDIGVATDKAWTHTLDLARSVPQSSRFYALGARARSAI